MTVPTNAAGTPLVLISTISGNSVTIDTSGIPAGVMGHVYTAPEVAAMTGPQRQNLLNQVFAKYDGVSVDEGAGMRAFKPEFEMTSEDDALRESLETLGATRPVAAPLPAPAVPVTPVVQVAPVAPTPLTVIAGLVDTASVVATHPASSPAHHWYDSLLSLAIAILKPLGAAALQEGEAIVVQSLTSAVAAKLPAAPAA